MVERYWREPALLAGRSILSLSEEFDDAHRDTVKAARKDALADMAAMAVNAGKSRRKS
jgi:hypothetical protein